MKSEVPKNRKLAMLLFFYLVMVDPAVAAGIPDPRPMSAPASTIEIVLSPTATPVSPVTLVAPGSAPSEADAPGAKPIPRKTKGQSRWRSSMALGGVFPQSAGLQSNYPLGFNASLGSGYQFSDLLSEWIILDFDHLSPRGAQGTQYNIVGLALWTKVNLTDSAISPFVFLGPGLAYNEIRSNTASGYDYYAGQFYFPVNAYEVDFLAETGIGLEWKLAETFRLFLEGKVTLNFLSSSFAPKALADSPSVLIPLQMGVNLGL